MMLMTRKMRRAIAVRIRMREALRVMAMIALV